MLPPPKSYQTLLSLVFFLFPSFLLFFDKVYPWLTSSCLVDPTGFKFRYLLSLATYCRDQMSTHPQFCFICSSLMIHDVELISFAQLRVICWLCVPHPLLPAGNKHMNLGALPMLDKHFTTELCPSDDDWVLKTKTTYTTWPYHLWLGRHLSSQFWFMNFIA